MLIWGSTLIRKSRVITTWDPHLRDMYMVSNVLENGIFVCIDTRKNTPLTTALRLVHKSVQIFALSGRPR